MFICIKLFVQWNMHSAFRNRVLIILFNCYKIVFDVRLVQITPDTVSNLDNVTNIFQIEKYILQFPLTK